MLRSKINSNIQDLNQLHNEYWWIPNENMIRPNPKILEDKQTLSEYILRNYMSFKDFILSSIFKCPVESEDGQLYVLDEVQKSEWNFSKSIFPYELPNGVNHYVLWNSKYDYFKDFEDSKINNMIKKTLEEIISSDDFDFAWYKNPKPSIPELYHVQVFWIRL